MKDTMNSITRSTSPLSSWESEHKQMSLRLHKYGLDPSKLLVETPPKITTTPAEAATETIFCDWMEQLRLRRIAMDVDLFNEEDGTYKLSLPDGHEVQIDRNGNTLANIAYADDAREEFYEWQDVMQHISPIYKLDQFATPGVVVEVGFRRRGPYPAPNRVGIVFKDAAGSITKVFGGAEVDDMVRHFYDHFVLPPPLPCHGVRIPSCQRLYPGIARPVECAWVLVLMEWHQEMLFRDPTLGVPLLEAWPNLRRCFPAEFNSWPARQQDPNQLLEEVTVLPTMVESRARDRITTLSPQD